MKSNVTKCLICDCEKSISLNLAKLQENTNAQIDKIHTHLCRAQLDEFETALDGEESLLITCTQEAPLFFEVAQESGRQDKLSFVNIRENAGWSEEAENATAKISAIINASANSVKPARLKSIKSDGLCLVYGAGQEALDAAKLLSEKLSVTLLLSDSEDMILPSIGNIPIYQGKITAVKGSFGDFALNVDNYAPMLPSSRAAPNFVMARDGAASSCSLILDMSGDAPLFSSNKHRDGYLHVDPADPVAVLHATITLSAMVGEFEKPIYVDFDQETCAHSRSNITGCSKCLDLCPAGAISENVDVISIDSGICAGCGSCHASCPTGSISYQYPQREDIIANCQSLISSYINAGGPDPVLLFHNSDHGEPLIAAMARYGRGLPANVLPIEVHAPTMLGHTEITALIASGANQIAVLSNANNSEEMVGLSAQIELSNTILTGLGLGEAPRASLILENDPDIVEERLWNLDVHQSLAPSNFQTAGSQREIARLAFSKLAEQSPTNIEIIALPLTSDFNAPYGALNIDSDACTLCMACTAVCPAGAIIDTPDEPKLRFVETNCVQCSLCVNTCPENALSLDPRLNLTTQAIQPVTLYEEEPFNCISCGTPFATISTIERITDQLAGSHAMFMSEEKINIIKMCDNCRIEAQANSEEDPFAVGQRPRIRTTEDYLDADKEGLSVDDFLIKN